MYKNMKKLVVMLMVLVATIGVRAQELKVGDALPKFELTSSVYGDIKSADLEGKVVLVSLFATWCGPCQKELAEVQNTLWPKYKDNKDFKMLVIGREHTDEDLQKYNERKSSLSRSIQTRSVKSSRCLLKSPFLVLICLIKMAS